MAKHMTRCPGCGTEYYVKDDAMLDVCQCPNCGRDFIPSDCLVVSITAKSTASGGWLALFCRAAGFLLLAYCLLLVSGLYSFIKSDANMGMLVLITLGLAVLSLPFFALAVILDNTAKAADNTNKICMLLNQVAKLKKTEAQNQGKSNNTL